eukprot:TRINITY_DN0_c1822_g1_i1.p1 TRINITY_DN0_c1822_g1~~TRINITY_DN0_c1822_g1_i1.p1  ORF type:complete len:120 (-),score=0.56 TRINITY_DN0_c1822_g1_i1:72-431(-)
MCIRDRADSNQTGKIDLGEFRQFYANARRQQSHQEQTVQEGVHFFEQLAQVPSKKSKCLSQQGLYCNLSFCERSIHISEQILPTFSLKKKIKFIKSERTSNVVNFMSDQGEQVREFFQR